MAYDTIPKDEVIEATKKALEANGFVVHIVPDGALAKAKALEIIPKGAEVMTMTSVTVDTIGLTHEINESGAYDALRPRFMKMDHTKDAREMRKLGAGPDWVTGSVHAVTEGGQVIIASATGSQLPAYAYGAGNVLWVVGAQKIIKNVDEGIKRIYEYTFPLENERAQKAYGMGSGVNKLLAINKEVQSGRITIILVKENIGF